MNYNIPHAGEGPNQAGLSVRNDLDAEHTDWLLDQWGIKKAPFTKNQLIKMFAEKLKQHPPRGEERRKREGRIAETPVQRAAKFLHGINRDRLPSEQAFEVLKQAHKKLSCAHCDDAAAEERSHKKRPAPAPAPAPDEHPVKDEVLNLFTSNLTLVEQFKYAILALQDAKRSL